MCVDAGRWYLGQILPGEYGIKRAWTFPCTGQRPGTTEGSTAGLLEAAAASDAGGSLASTRSAVVEEEAPADLEVRVVMRGLRKVYEKSSTREEVVAVDHLDLDLYSGQIFALLGHNGAGKSSLIGMLTGLFEASAGSIEVWVSTQPSPPPAHYDFQTGFLTGRLWPQGHDLATNTNQARQMMGVCPQHDVLFEKLTCIEHLRIFAGIKGSENGSDDAALEELLRLVDLGEKRNGVASELSGGQKRKLSLAVVRYHCCNTGLRVSSKMFSQTPLSLMAVAAMRLKLIGQNMPIFRPILGLS